jgi:F0F1-type ATP synthase membrane subunit b/b'
MSEQEARALEDLLFDLRELIEQARMMPMSASVLVNRDEALAMIEDALGHMPEELRRARWLLKERDEFLAEARRDAAVIVDAARTQAERMVERTEIAREARRMAERVVADAEADARRLSHEADDFIDARLQTFQETLERTLESVRKGRDRLQPDADPGGTGAGAPEPDPPERDFFDQDQA